MRSILKRLSLLPGLAALLLTGTLGASAAAPEPSPATMVGGSAFSAAAAQACDALRAGPVTWVTLDDQGEIERRVTEYPSGTVEIVPTFEYACVPKNTTI